jgi:hypothetical protein
MYEDMPYISKDVIRVYQNLGVLGRGQSLDEEPIQPIAKKTVHRWRLGSDIVTEASSLQDEHSAILEVLVRRVGWEMSSRPIHSESRTTKELDELYGRILPRKRGSSVAKWAGITTLGGCIWERPLMPKVLIARPCVDGVNDFILVEEKIRQRTISGESS